MWVILIISIILNFLVISELREVRRNVHSIISDVKFINMDIDCLNAKHSELSDSVARFMFSQLTNGK